MRRKLFLIGLTLALVTQTACSITVYQWQLIAFYLTGSFLSLLKTIFDIPL